VILSVISEAGIPVETPLPEEYKAKGQRGRMIFCMRADEVIRLVTLRYNREFNEHEAHAVYMCIWQEHRLKMGMRKAG
jgi:hypothetical protein